MTKTERPARGALFAFADCWGRFLLLAFVFMLLFQPLEAFAEDLAEADLLELLYELNRQGDGEGAFLVLPDDFSMPVAGADGEFRLLLIGVDADRADFTGRSDSVILAVINTRLGTLKLISFMRDLYVQIPGRGHNRLNAAYAFGGAQLLLKTLEENFGVSADAYVAVDYSGFVQLLDAVGGIELEVSPEELGPLNGILSYYNQQNDVHKDEGLLGSPGRQLLTGLQSLSYARIRKIGDDFARVGRQQAVLYSAYQRVVQLDSTVLAGVLLEQFAAVKTDLTVSDCLRLLDDVLGVDGFRLLTHRIPVNGSYASKVMRGASFLVPNLKRNRMSIEDFLALP